MPGSRKARPAGCGRACRGTVCARRGAGFTLIELVVVLTLIGIVSAMAVPRLSGMMAKSRTQGALNQLASDVALARSLALQSRHSATLRYDGSGYTVTATDARGTRVVKQVDLAADHRGVQIVPPGGVQDSLVFNSRGLVSVGSNYFIRAVGGGTRDSLMVSRIGRVYREY